MRCFNDMGLGDNSSSKGNSKSDRKGKEKQAVATLIISVSSTQKGVEGLLMPWTL